MPLPRLPSQCAVCRGWGAARVCGRCVERFAPRGVARCGRCAAPCPVPVCAECLCAAPPQSRAVAALTYAYPWDRVLSALKFRAGLELAPVLADLLAQAVRACAAAPQVDIVTAVPLGRERLRERGYNQAWELARRVARTLALPAEAHALQRLADTPQQAALPRGRRLANVRGCFGVERAERVRGQRVALVDDVMTTGATLREAARVLLDAGAARVEVWVAARTPPTIG